MTEQGQRPLDKPSEILRRPEHAEHWFWGAWHMTIMRPEKGRLVPIQCMCPTEVLFHEALKLEDVAVLNRDGMLGRADAIAVAWYVPAEVVAAGIAINDKLSPDQVQVYDELLFTATLAHTRTERSSATRRLYRFLQSLAPERLEAVAAHYESHGF